MSFHLRRRDQNRQDLFNGFTMDDLAKDLDWFRDDTVTPPMEMKETEEGYKVSMELPGIDKENVNVSVENDHLIIQGEKQSERTEENPEGVILSERSYGSFYREFALPDDVNPEALKAQLKNGLLEIEMQRGRPSSKSAKQIKID